MIAGEPEPLPEPRSQPTPLNGVDVLTAPVAGVLAYRKHWAMRVSAGEGDGRLVDRSLEPLARLASGGHDPLIARMGERLARARTEILQGGGTEPLSYRQSREAAGRLGAGDCASRPVAYQDTPH